MEVQHSLRKSTMSLNLSPNSKYKYVAIEDGSVIRVACCPIANR